MFVLLKDDQEAKAARIDEATQDWLESQVFPTIPLIWERDSLRCLDRFVTPVIEPVEISSIVSRLPRTAAAA